MMKLIEIYVFWGFRKVFTEVRYKKERERYIESPRIPIITRLLAWKTVTVAQSKVLKCFRSQMQLGSRRRISSHVQVREPSSRMQNLPPNRYMPSTLRVCFCICFRRHEIVKIEKKIIVLVRVKNGINTNTQTRTKSALTKSTIIFYLIYKLIKFVLFKNKNW